MKPDPIATSLGRVLEAGWKPSEKGRDRTGHGGMKPEPCVLEDGSGRPERPAGTGPVCLRPRGVVSSHWLPGSSGRTATPPFPPSIPELPSCSGSPLPDASFDGRLRPHDSSAICLLFPYHRHKKNQQKRSVVSPSMSSGLHAPTVPSGPTTQPVANGRTTHLTLPELQRRKDNVEAELKALGSVLDSVGDDGGLVKARSVD